MLRFRSKSSAIGWTGAGADVTDVDTTSSSMRHRKLPWFVARHQRTLGPFLAASHEHRYDSLTRIGAPVKISSQALSLSLSLLALAQPLAAQGPPPQGGANQPYTMEYYYKVQWG